MDFFAHQEAARQRTRLLLFYYTLAVIALVAASYVVAVLFLRFLHVRTTGSLPYWDLKLFTCTTGLTLFIITVGTLFRIMDLREGGPAVAEMLGGEKVPLDPVDERQRMLRNVVEEMSIASSVSVPHIYVLPRETGINAFAAGYSTADAAVAVTRGCLEKLSRDELQGVIAHEFSHILNGDMRLNIRLLGVLNGILGIYLIGRVAMDVDDWFDPEGRRRRGFITAIGLAMMALGGLGVFFSKLIQAAVSRQREFLADASAVQFTRNPGGIADALKKIGGSTSKLRNSQAEAASHFFFGNGVSEPWFTLFATHPPLAERIKRIEPTFDGTFAPLAEVEEPPVHAFSPGPPITSPALSQLAASSRVRAERIVRRTGAPLRVQYAAGLLETLPADLREAAHEPLQAAALTFALVLHTSAAIRGEQLRRLYTTDASVAPCAEEMSERVGALDARLRLPLLQLCLPALRTLSGEQWQQFRAALEDIICCDAQVDLFEFVLRRIIERNVDAKWRPRRAAIVQFYSFNPLAADCALLLSALAHVGAGDDPSAARAFENGAAQLPMSLEPRLSARDQCGVQSIDAALTRIAAAVPHIKRVVLEACAHTVACDGFVNANEAELLRAIGESLDCPIPPFVEGV